MSAYKGHRRRDGRLLPAAGAQLARFERVWARLHGAPGSAQSNYTRVGIGVSAGVALASVILWLGHAERTRRRTADKSSPR